MLTAPWYAPLRGWLDALGESAVSGHWSRVLPVLNRAAAERGLANAQGLPLCFVDAAAVRAEAYESHIWATGEVPTRLGEGAWHDFFNALMWLTMPRTKARLNALQAEAIAREGIGAHRGALRDAATLFDENAAVVLLDDPGLQQAWQCHDWRALLVQGRERFLANGPPLLFGHALLDKLRAPYKAICAHAWVVPALPDPGAPDPRGEWPDTLGRLDAHVAGSLDSRRLCRAAFRPLPVLGVPGWWARNLDPLFYDDPSVFRPPRAGAPGRRLTPSLEMPR